MPASSYNHLFGLHRAVTAPTKGQGQSATEFSKSNSKGEKESGEGGSILWFGLNRGITGKHPEWTGSRNLSYPQRVQPPGVLTWCLKSLPAPSQRLLKPTPACPSTCDNALNTQMTPNHLLVLSLPTRNIYSPFKSFSLPVFSLVFTATLKQSQKRL